jgi:hypothetical protein
VAAEAVLDLFELRSYPGAPGSGAEGHHFGEADSALVTVKVPGTTLAEAARNGLSIRLYRIGTARRLERLDLVEVSRLCQEGELDLQWEVAGAELVQAIRLKGRNIPVP